MRIQIGALATSGGGSALVEMGLTVVLAAVRGPIECTRRSDELSDRYVVYYLAKESPPCVPVVVKQPENVHNSPRVLLQSRVGCVGADRSVCQFGRSTGHEPLHRSSVD